MKQGQQLMTVTGWHRALTSCLQLSHAARSAISNSHGTTQNTYILLVMIIGSKVSDIYGPGIEQLFTFCCNNHMQQGQQ
jgi:hypothetical protein